MRLEVHSCRVLLFRSRGLPTALIAMEEIAKVITDISESSTAVSDTANSALTSVQSGKQSMSLIKNQVENISSSAGEVLGMVKSLNGYSEEIGGALHTVKDFA